MRLGRQRGRKRILAPDGSELTPPTRPQPDGVLVKALARAWRWQKLLDRGVYASVTEIAEAEKISKSYVSRILRLALLAPDLVEAILGGWADQRVMLERLERPLPLGGRTGLLSTHSPRAVTSRVELIRVANKVAERCFMMQKTANNVWVAAWRDRNQPPGRYESPSLLRRMTIGA